jgi:ABC-type phosphate/phosphonate transport system substrate-binding protein
MHLILKVEKVNCKNKIGISKNIMKKMLSTILILIFVCSNIIAQDKNDFFNVVMSTEIIGDVNKSDAMSALKIWVRQMLHEAKVEAQINPVFANSVDEIIIKLKQNKADFVGLSAYDFLKYKKEMQIEPYLVLSRNSMIEKKYLLITSNNSNINSYADLKLKKILTYNNSEAEIIKMWLFVEMKKDNIKNPLEIITRFDKSIKSNKRVFKVFFGKADACIISKTGYESMCELNPQLKKQLKVLLESPTFLTEIYCTNANSSKTKASYAKKYAPVINNSDNGAQMLKIFRAFKVLDYKYEYLETIENLFENYQSLLATDKDN